MKEKMIDNYSGVGVTSSLTIDRLVMPFWSRCIPPSIIDFSHASVSLIRKKNVYQREANTLLRQSSFQPVSRVTDGIVSPLRTPPPPSPTPQSHPAVMTAMIEVPINGTAFLSCLVETLVFIFSVPSVYFVFFLLLTFFVV